MATKILHQTDLFHFHCDPDDHWDLACQYALAHEGDTELTGILIDYPPNADYGDPAIQAVHQLNYLTGQAIPVGVGSPEALKKNSDAALREGAKTSGVRMVLNKLKEAEEPVVIHIVGSCRDIAIAFRLEPELFEQKCRAIYLNAGTSRDEVKVDYNVELDAYAYRIMFELPCDIYWIPCIEYYPVPPALPYEFTPGEFSSFYEFKQNEVLPHLSRGMQNYFTYALGKVSDHRWLSYLNLPKNEGMLEYHGNRYRNMWSTAGMLHSAGKTVDTVGNIITVDDKNTSHVFSFLPATITCRDSGKTDWKLSAGYTGKFIFRINNMEKYAGAMTRALRTMLSSLP